MKKKLPKMANGLVKTQLGQEKKLLGMSKLPGMSENYLSNKIAAHDRLYYGNKYSKHYGKIQSLLNKIKLKLPETKRKIGKGKKKSPFSTEEDNKLFEKKLL